MKYNSGTGKKKPSKSKAAKKSRAKQVDKVLSGLGTNRPTRAQRLAKVKAKKQQERSALSGALRSYSSRVGRKK